LRRWRVKNGVAKVVRTSIAIERDAFVTAYMMRKLYEAGALTENVISRSGRS
jgi:hypothetical protein